MYPQEQRSWILLPESFQHLSLTLYLPRLFKDTLGTLSANVQGRAPPEDGEDEDDPFVFLSAFLLCPVSHFNWALESRPHCVCIPYRITKMSDAFLLVPLLRFTPTSYNRLLVSFPFYRVEGQFQIDI